jgi:hypothetical protein
LLRSTTLAKRTGSCKELYKIEWYVAKVRRLGVYGDCAEDFLEGRRKRSACAVNNDASAMWICMVYSAVEEMFYFSMQL